MKNNIRLFRIFCVVLVTIAGVFFLLATWGGCGGSDGDTNNSEEVNDNNNDIEVAYDPCNYNIDIVCEEITYKMCEKNDGSIGYLQIFKDKLIFPAIKGCQNTASWTMCELDNTGNIEVIFERELDYPGKEFFNYGFESIVIDNILYFYFNHLVGISTFNIYKYDGSNPVELIFSKESDPMRSGGLLEYNQKLYFTYFDPLIDDFKLYSYDGNNILKDIGNARIRGNAVYNDKLYFFQSSDPDNIQLWCYDENTDQMYQVGDAYTEIFPKYGLRFMIFQGKLFYSASDDVNGGQVWMIDGENPPVTVSDWPISEDLETGYRQFSASYPLGVVNDKGLYSVWESIAWETPHDQGFWEYDGISWSKIDFEDTYEFNASGLIYNDHYYYGGATGFWGYDGVNAPVKIFDTEGYVNFIGIDAYNNKLFFYADDLIFVYDGTSDPGNVVEMDSNISSILGFNDDYFFAGPGPTDEYGNELWEIDNTGQVSLVEDFFPGTTCYCIQ